jgi:hypothetical protein
MIRMMMIHYSGKGGGRRGRAIWNELSAYSFRSVLDLGEYV